VVCDPLIRDAPVALTGQPQSAPLTRESGSQLMLCAIPAPSCMNRLPTQIWMGGRMHEASLSILHKAFNECAWRHYAPPVRALPCGCSATDYTDPGD